MALRCTAHLHTTLMLLLAAILAVRRSPCLPPPITACERLRAACRYVVQTADMRAMWTAYELIPTKAGWPAEGAARRAGTAQRSQCA